MQRIENALRHCPTEELRQLLTTACTTALSAGKVIRSRYHQPHTIRMKGAIDLVTEADLASESLILSRLGEATPHIPVMAEESSPELSVHDQPRYWVVDPLDGTTNFAHSLPHFAVSIALFEAGQPLVGAVYQPIADELYCASLGGGTWLNDEQVHVTGTRETINTLIATGFPYDVEHTLETVLRHMQRMLPAVRDIRRAGAAALDLAYVACGRLDGFYELNLKPWDVGAGWLLVTEAGGQLSDFSGQPYTPFGTQTLASNTQVHADLVRLLQ